MAIITNTNLINHCNRLTRRDVPEANADAAGSGTSLQNLSVSLFFQIGIIKFSFLSYLIHVP